MAFRTDTDGDPVPLCLGGGRGQTLSQVASPCEKLHSPQTTQPGVSPCLSPDQAQEDRKLAGEKGSEKVLSWGLSVRLFGALSLSGQTQAALSGRSPVPFPESLSVSGEHG